MKPIYDESLYCQECGVEISVAESKFNGYLCSECAFSTEMEREVIFSHGNYEEIVKKSNVSVRLVECAELGIVKLYRIEYQDMLGHEQHKVAYTLNEAIELYNRKKGG